MAIEWQPFLETALVSSQAPSLQIQNVGSSSQVVGGVNVVTITVLPNVAIMPPATIIITGCVSETADTETLTLSGPGAELFVDKVATWSQEDRRLSLEIATGRTMPAGIHYCYSGTGSSATSNSGMSTSCSSNC